MAKWGDAVMALGGVLVSLAGFLWATDYPQEVAQWVAVAGVVAFVLGVILRLLARNGHKVIRDSPIQSRRDGDGDQVIVQGNYIRGEDSASRDSKDVKPRLNLERFYVKPVPFTARSGKVLEWDLLSMVFTNVQTAGAKTSSARAVFPTFTLTGFATPLPWVEARNDYSPQPFEVPRNERPVRVFEVSVGQWAEINLIVRISESGLCYLFGNDFYAPVNRRIPEGGIGPGTYTVEVKLNCEGMEEQRFECRVTNEGQGGSLTVGEFRQTTSFD